jgi:hypothetical protein
MVEDIAVNALQIPKSRFSLNEVEVTDFTTNIIIPNWAPFYALNWLSTIAISTQSPSASYVFFENRTGYHFTSIEAMFRGSSVLTIQVAPRNLGKTRATDQTAKKLQGVLQWEIPNGCDELQTISMGAYAGALTIIDLNTQSFKTFTLQSDTQFAQVTHANKFTLLQALPNRFNQLPQAMTSSLYRVMPNSSDVDRWMLQRNMYMATLHAHRVSVAVPGNLELTAGAVVTCQFPVATGHHDAEKQLDTTYSGVYIVAAVQHKLDRAKFISICELMKDTRSTALPAVSGELRTFGVQ